VRIFDQDFTNEVVVIGNSSTSFFILVLLYPNVAKMDGGNENILSFPECLSAVTYIKSLRANTIDRYLYKATDCAGSLLPCYVLLAPISFLFQLSGNLRISLKIAILLLL